MPPRKGQGMPPGVPGYLKKKRLLNEAQLAPALCRELGDKFFDLGWWDDALEFYQKGDVTEGLEKLRAQALESGDAFLLARLGKDHDPQVWRALADRALALEKFHFARRAYELAGDLDKTALAAGLMAGLGAESSET
jgi:hypothetical protein